MVFQGYGLFPHMNVRQNIGYGLSSQKLPAGEIDARVSEAIALVQLAELAERRIRRICPAASSSVSRLARALVMRAAGSAARRAAGRARPQAPAGRCRRSCAASTVTIGGTFVFVTHDQGEALALANRIAVMKDGRIEQVGTPEEIYFAPATRFVATFIGEANLLKGVRRNGQVEAAAGIVWPAPGPDGAVALVARPESTRRLAPGEVAEVELSGVVEEVIFFGAHVRYVLALASGRSCACRIPAGSTRAVIGERMRVGWNASAQQVIAESAR